MCHNTDTYNSAYMDVSSSPPSSNICSHSSSEIAFSPAAPRVMTLRPRSPIADRNSPTVTPCPSGIMSMARASFCAPSSMAARVSSARRTPSTSASEKPDALAWAVALSICANVSLPIGPSQLRRHVAIPARRHHLLFGRLLRVRLLLLTNELRQLAHRLIALKFFGLLDLRALFRLVPLCQQHVIRHAELLFVDGGDLALFHFVAHLRRFPLARNVEVINLVQFQ